MRNVPNLARLQEERRGLLRLMLQVHANGYPYSFKGHPWSNIVRDLHDQSADARRHS